MATQLPNAQLEALENRLLLAGSPEYRSIDGSGNNAAHPSWGTPLSALDRLAPNQYGDGISTPAGAARPGARELSNLIFDQHRPEDIFNAEGMSAFAYAWGQFIDHDLSLTNNASPAVAFNIPVPAGDIQFDPFYSGTQVIGLNRSQTAADTGMNSANPRQQPNAITAFLDGSQVYGSDSVRAAVLRTFVDGKLKTSHEGTQLPYNVDNLPNQTAGGPASAYFLAGDVRANENSELTSIHVLFVREHNRLATIIKQQNRRWNDEQIYQQARRLVIGELQQITYNEFLPSILMHTLPAYTGYKPGVDSQIANEFSTAAFRFGHSILGDDVQFFDDDAQTTLPDLKVAETFFAPNQQLDGGTDGLLKYLAAVSSQEMDQHLVNGIRNFLFGPPGAGGFDLGSLDIQRGRDHGLSDFNTTRAAMGLPKHTSFTQMVSNPQLASALQTLYGSVDNVDLFLGGMCEARADGHVLGPTFERIIADQFTRTRDGDRFWYQRDLDKQDLKFIKNLSLSELIKLNTSITNIQPNAFHFDVRITGQVWNDANGNGHFDPSEHALTGHLVYLLDDENSVIDFVQTDPQGRYVFNKIQVGDYTTLVDTNGNWQPTTADPGAFHVNRDVQFNNVNFGLRQTARAALPIDAVVLSRPSAQISGTDASKLIDGDIVGTGLI